MKEVPLKKSGPKGSKSTKQNGRKKTATAADKKKSDFDDSSSEEDEVLSSKKRRPAKKSAKSSKTIRGGSKNGISYHTEPSKTDPTKTVVVLDKPKPVFTKTAPVETALDDPQPVTFNQYYRHKCKLATVKTAKQITGQVR